MFERFTDAARRVVVSAQEEARSLKHNYIGTEHVLLGLLAEPDGAAARALAGAGVTPENARDQIVKIVNVGDTEPHGHIPFTPRAKKVLELSLREALHLRHHDIGSEHILLGILREGQGVAAQALAGLGTDTERLRREVVRLAGSARRAGPDEPLTPRPAHTPAAAEVLATAEELASGSPIGSHHLLEALARSHRSAAGHALAAAGVDVEVLAAKLDEVGLEGTTDLTPEEEAARQAEIRLDGDEVHLVLRDPAVVDRVRAVSGHLGGPIRGTDPVASGMVPVHQAVVRYLERLRRRLEPTAEGPEGERPRGPAAVVRLAMRSRLHRRRQP